MRGNTYWCFGLSIWSELELPELTRLEAVEPETQRFDVTIRIGDVPLDDKRLRMPYEHIVMNGDMYFHVPEHAFFQVRNGDSITVMPLANHDPSLVRIYVLGSCMGALLMQRRVIPLHGSAIEIGNKVYAFVGESGAGKSTLARVLLQKGYALASDDVIAVHMNDAGAPQMMPSYPQQKLWQSSLDRLDMNTQAYDSIYGRETKYAVPVMSKSEPRPYDLGGIFELGISSSNELHMLPLSKLERLSVLHQHTYRQFLIPQFGLTAWHFAQLTRIAQSIPHYRIFRPAEGFSAVQLADRIIEQIQKDVEAC